MPACCSETTDASIRETNRQTARIIWNKAQISGHSVKLSGGKVALIDWELSEERIRRCCHLRLLLPHLKAVPE